MLITKKNFVVYVKASFAAFRPSWNQADVATDTVLACNVQVTGINNLVHNIWLTWPGIAFLTIHGSGQDVQFHHPPSLKPRFRWPNLFIFSNVTNVYVTGICELLRSCLLVLAVIMFIYLCPVFNLFVILAHSIRLWRSVPPGKFSPNTGNVLGIACHVVYHRNDGVPVLILNFKIYHVMHCPDRP